MALRAFRLPGQPQPSNPPLWLPLTPSASPPRLTQAQRIQVRNTINQLIELLDAADGDGDFEPVDAIEGGRCEVEDVKPGNVHGLGDLDDAEDSHDAEWDTDDREPSDANESNGHSLTTVAGGVPA